jgi:hypothetical protein
MLSSHLPKRGALRKEYVTYRDWRFVPVVIFEEYCRIRVDLLTS